MNYFWNPSSDSRFRTKKSHAHSFDPVKVNNFQVRTDGRIVPCSNFIRICHFESYQQQSIFKTKRINRQDHSATIQRPKLFLSRGTSIPFPLDRFDQAVIRRPTADFPWNHFMHTDGKTTRCDCIWFLGPSLIIIKNIRMIKSELVVLIDKQIPLTWYDFPFVSTDLDLELVQIKSKMRCTPFMSISTEQFQSQRLIEFVCQEALDT